MCAEASVASVPSCTELELDDAAARVLADPRAHVVDALVDLDLALRVDGHQSPGALALNAVAVDVAVAQVSQMIAALGDEASHGARGRLAPCEIVSVWRCLGAKAS